MLIEYNGLMAVRFSEKRTQGRLQKCYLNFIPGLCKAITITCEKMLHFRQFFPHEANTSDALKLHEG